MWDRGPCTPSPWAVHSQPSGGQEAALGVGCENWGVWVPCIPGKVWQCCGAQLGRPESLQGRRPGGSAESLFGHRVKDLEPGCEGQPHEGRTRVVSGVFRELVRVRPSVGEHDTAVASTGGTWREAVASTCSTWRDAVASTCGTWREAQLPRAAPGERLSF